MSVRSILDCNPNSVDFMKISPSYIPSSVNPIGNDSTMAVFFDDAVDNFNIPTGNKIIKVYTNQVVCSDKFNFIAPKMAVSISANIFFTATHNNHNLQQAHPQKVYFELYNNSIPSAESNRFYVNPVYVLNGANPDTVGVIQWCLSLNDIITPTGWVDNIDTLLCQFTFEFADEILGSLAGSSSLCNASVILTPCL